MQRRKFLEILATGLPLLITKPVKAMDTGYITRAQFQSQIGAMFSLSLKGARLAQVALLSVTKLQPSLLLSGECFSVVFAGPRDVPLTQGTYRLENKALGRFDMLLVPGRIDVNGRHYEGIVNRLR